MKRENRRAKYSYAGCAGRSVRAVRFAYTDNGLVFDDRGALKVRICSQNWSCTSAELQRWFIT